MAAVVILLVTLVVPAADFGRFNLMMAMTQIITAATLSFPNLGLLRFAREDFTLRGSIGEALATRGVVHLVLLLVALPVAWLSFPWLAERMDVPANIYPLLILALLIVSASEMGTVTAQSVGSLVGYAGAQVLFRLLQIATLVLMYVSAINSWMVLFAGTMIGYAAGACLAWSRVPGRTLHPFKPSLVMFRRFATFSWSIPLAGLTLVVINWMDIWFIGYYSDLENVGVYSWAYNLLMAATALLAPLVALIGPKTIDLKARGDLAQIGQMVVRAQGLFLLTIALMPLGAASLVAVMALFPLGAYSGAVSPALILIGAMAFQLGRNIWEPQVFSFEKLVVRGTAIIVMMGLVNAIGDLILIPIMGITGAALATALAFACGALGMLILIRRHLSCGGPSLFGLAFFCAVTIASTSAATAMPFPFGFLFCAIATLMLVTIGHRAGFFQELSAAFRESAERQELPAWLARVATWTAAAPNDTADDEAVAARIGKIDILVICPHLHVGGTERHLLQVLPLLDRTRFSPRLFTMRKGGSLEPKFRAAGVPVISPSSSHPRPFHLFSALTLLLKVLLRDRPDIVHFFLPEAYIIGGLAALLSRRRRLVMSRRSLNNYQARHFLGAWVERQLHKRMKVVVGNSMAVVDQLRVETGAPERLGLIYNGIDLTPFKGAPRDRAMLGVPGITSQTLVLTMVANLIGYKGHLDLLKALARIQDELPTPWVLLLVGRDTGIGTSLQAAARELGIAPHIRWLGERDDVVALFQATDIGILCSHEEGFSNALLEGMAAGIPMVATKVGGNAEAVLDGRTGLLVPTHDAAALGDAILGLAHDPARRGTLGAAGKKLVEWKYSLATCVARYEQLYLALAADSQDSLGQFITSSGKIR